MKKNDSCVLLYECKIQITLEKVLTKYNEVGGREVTQECFFVDLFSDDTDPKAKAVIDAIGFKSRISDYFRAANGAASRFVNMRAFLLRQKDDYGEEVIYSTCPIRKRLESNWRKLLQQFSKEQCLDLRDWVKTICAELPLEEGQGTDTSLTKRISDSVGDLVQNNLAGAMACLTLISCTLFCWNHFSSDTIKKKARVSQLRESQNKSENQAMYSIVLPAKNSDVFEMYLLDATKALDEGQGYSEDEGKIKQIKENLDKAKEAPPEMGAIKARAYYQYSRFWRQRYDIKGNVGLLDKCKEDISAAARLGHLKAAREQNEFEAAEYFYKGDLAPRGRPGNRKFLPMDVQTEGKAWTLWKRYEMERSRQALKACFDTCQRVLNFQPQVSDRYRGAAAYLLYCCACVGMELPKGENKEKYLILSHDCRFPKAQDAWENFRQETREKEEKRLIPSQYPADSNDSAGAFSLLCDDEVLTALVQNTSPTEWHEIKVEDPAKWNEVLSTAVQYASFRLLLLCKNEDRNLHLFLHVLQSVRDGFPMLTVGKMEIFIRGHEDHLRQLIDTALSHMEGQIIPVTIIDDDKWPAQFLLTYHPVFYPMRFLPDNVRAELNLVIFGNSRLVEYIVREAFSLAGFRDSTLSTKITVFTNNAEEFQKRMYSRCPGLALDRKLLNAIGAPKIETREVNIDDYHSCLKVIKELYLQQETYCYFAIAVGDAQENLSLAMQLREQWIRLAVGEAEDWASPLGRLDDPPPIAFYCPDDYVAHLSRRLVAEKEEWGDQWFNNWGLIPFGNIAARYSWANLQGHLDRLVQTIHLQYTFGGIRASESERIDALKDLYKRQYNVESSMAVACSLPYRLFQFKCREDHRNTNVRLVPLYWRILDTSDALENLADRLNERGVLTEDEISAMAEWEHNRWIRWCITQGWLSISSMQSSACFHFGNPRHQLYIAKLHPCMCPTTELVKLSKDLKEKCNMERDFYSLDRLAIELTDNALRQEWYCEHKEREEER